MGMSDSSYKKQSATDKAKIHDESLSRWLGNSSDNRRATLQGFVKELVQFSRVYHSQKAD